MSNKNKPCRIYVVGPHSQGKSTLVILLAPPLAPMTALADVKEPVQVDVVVLVITHVAFLVKLHVITIVLLFVLYLLCTVETRKKVY